MSNVIQFPSRRNISSPTTEEEIISNVDKIKYNHINETLNAIVPMIFHNIDLAGFEFGIEESEQDIYVKDGSFLVEAIRSMLCKYHDIEHPFQFIAENIFIRDENGNYELAEKLELDLQSFIVKEESES